MMHKAKQSSHMNLSFMQSKVFWKKNAVKPTKKNKGTAVSQEFLCQHTVQLGSTFISIPHIMLITNLDAVLMFSFNSFFPYFKFIVFSKHSVWNLQYQKKPPQVQGIWIIRSTWSLNLNPLKSPWDHFKCAKETNVQITLNNRGIRDGIRQMIKILILLLRNAFSPPQRYQLCCARHCTGTQDGALPRGVPNPDFPSTSML